MKKNQNRQPAKKEERPVTLGDLLNLEVVEKLKAQKHQLQEQEEKLKEAELLRKKEELRLKEKNKSFEDLLTESNMDWKKFK